MNFFVKWVAFFAVFVGVDQIFSRLDKTPTNHALRYVVAVIASVAVLYGIRVIEHKKRNF